MPPLGPKPRDRAPAKESGGGVGQAACPVTKYEAFLNSYQARQILDNPNPSKTRPKFPGKLNRRSEYDIKVLLMGPRNESFMSFINKRCMGYSAKYPLGIRYQRDKGPQFDPDEFAGRPHPAVASNIFVKQTQEEKEKLKGPSPNSG